MLPNQTQSRFRARIQVGIAGLVFVGLLVVAIHAVEAWVRFWI